MRLFKTNKEKIAETSAEIQAIQELLNKYDELMRAGLLDNVIICNTFGMASELDNIPSADAFNAIGGIRVALKHVIDSCDDESGRF